VRAWLMPATADLSPSGVARLLHELVAALAIDGCTLVGNDTGGALCQFAIDQDPTPFAALVLTNCDAFTDFPPRPFGWLRWVGRRPRLLRALYGPMRATVVRRAAYRVLARRPIPGERCTSPTPASVVTLSASWRRSTRRSWTS
jgi:pimeloyl-ACP methyl ester carboxylesterase